MKIKKIRFTDLMYWETATRTWKDLYALDPATSNEVILGPGATHQISFYDAGSLQGLDPTQNFLNAIRWDRFQVADTVGVVTDGWTIFKEEGVPESKLIPDKVKSLRIRYKLAAHDDSDPVNVYAPNQYYYMIVSGAYPADHITYTGAITTGAFAPTVYIKLPGVNNSMVPDSANLFTWLTDVRNWCLEWRRPDGSLRSFAPNSATITGTYGSIDENFNGAYVELKLPFPTLMIGQSGTHVLTMSFLPNDQQSSGFHVFADTHTWTAVLTAYEPSMRDPLLLSFDKGLFMSIEFNQVEP